MNKALVFVSTHVAAGLAGWLAFRGATAAAVPQGLGSSSKAFDRNMDRQEALRLLGEMRRAWKTEELAAQAAASAAEDSKDSAARSARESRATVAKEHEEIRRQVEGYVLPADPAAELARLLKARDTLALIPLVIAWLKEDPEAALRHFDGLDESMWTRNLVNVLDLWVEHAGTSEAIRLLDHSPKWRGRMAEAVLKVAVAEDPSALGSLMESLEGRMDRAAILRAAFSDVPENKRTEALDWMMANLKGREAGITAAQAAYAMGSNGDPAGAKAFLKAAVARLDADAMQELEGWGNYAQILGYGVGPGSPMEERLEIALLSYLPGKTEEERRTQALAKIVSNDVSNWFRAGVWDEALRAGSLDTAQLWSECESAFPEFQGPERDTMLKTLFKQAAIEDPKGALALLEKEGKESEAAAYVLSALGSSIYSDLEAGIQLAGMLPDDAIRGQLPSYDRYYGGSQIARVSEELGSYWTDWLIRQPAGLNRDLLLHHTATALSKRGLDREAAGLRALIQDPDVKNRSTPQP